MKKPFTKDGRELLGTLELVEGCSYVEGVEDDGTIEYSGETKMFWDGQKTVERDGERVWLDEEGEEFLESEIVWKEEEECT